MELLRQLIEIKSDHVPIMEALYALDVIVEMDIEDMTDRVVTDDKGVFWVDREDVKTGKQLVKSGDEVLFTHEGQKYHGKVTSRAKGRDDDVLQVRAKPMHENTRGGMIRKGLGKASKFMRANPALVVGAAALAVAAHGACKRNKRNTISLFAKDAYERRMMTSIVDALTKGGKFRVVRTKFSGGGKSWILKRHGR